MPDKLKEYYRESIDRMLASLSPAERLKGLSAKERLAGLTAEEVAQALPPETREALARELKANGHSSGPQ